MQTDKLDVGLGSGSENISIHFTAKADASNSRNDVDGPRQEDQEFEVNPGSLEEDLVWVEPGCRFGHNTAACPGVAFTHTHEAALYAGLLTRDPNEVLSLQDIQDKKPIGDRPSLKDSLLMHVINREADEKHLEDFCEKPEGGYA
ncbi:hypothetical protein ACRRTK_024839 [Alexandromys fortis]